ncbi:tagaturonate reductase [Ilyomonas limi]|uniref:Tagaturonate reductase n=1 Tax=Ilyomonas limi TaxID=2575867 RepID=A0A4U3KTW9_9BACT|nr:tagaturonate reductase [Ilyomonas limi]TKK65831.1 tagaturonate reductase [Ilyomonas limi]
MQLSKHILSQITGAEVPPASCFDLPEKVIQFGTGVLLRGLPDYYIDKANKQGIFNGRIVVVKSTGNSDTAEFENQDCLYTQCICGVQKGAQVNYNIINAAISRVLHAKSQWEAVLECAANPELQIVISNTTEVGIVYTEESIFNTPPASFPGKLLAFLYRRFEVFNGAADKGMVIVPTELIIDNGVKLKDILQQLARYNNLPEDFINWLQNSHTFCNSLVDRIVPGKPAAPFLRAIEASLGYTDDLLIMSEPYSLWAIETANSKATEMLSFALADDTVIIAPDISLYRELKLRLLNGSHTFSCGLAHLAGFVSVEESMHNEAFASFIQSLMLDEIAPAIKDASIPESKKEEFAMSVLDRFRNPFIEHKWLNITLQYSSKMAMRNVPLITSYFHRFNSVPVRMALGFAAHLLFMRCRQEEDGKWHGKVNGQAYVVNDDNAAYYAEVWQQQKRVEAVATTILSNKELWGEDLLSLSGFADKVIYFMNELMHNGVQPALYEADKQKTVM